MSIPTSRLIKLCMAKTFRLLCGFAAALLLAANLPADPVNAQEGPSATRKPMFFLQPHFPGQESTANIRHFTDEEIEAARERKEAISEAVRERAGRKMAPIAGAEGNPKTPPVRIVDGNTRRLSNDSLLIGRNERNRVAQTSGFLSEPAAVNNRRQVFYSGNFYNSVSKDHGVTWRNLAIPGGLADAPSFCCDTDAIVDPVTGTAITLELYIDPANSKTGNLRIGVRDPHDYNTEKCSYTLDSAGAADNELQDFAKIGQSKTYVWVSASIIDPGTGRSRMWYIGKPELLACVNIGLGFFDQTWDTEGQHIWRPAGGAETRTYTMWAHAVDTTHMRVFKWNDADALPTSVVRTVSPSDYSGQDCRGGVGNFDWNASGDGAGFNMSCAIAQGVDQTPAILTCYNQSAPMVNRPQAFLRGTSFRVTDRKLIGEPDLFSNDMCIGYPILSSNNRGDLGFSVAAGGKTGGGGSAVQGYVGMRTPSETEMAVVAGGVANQSGGRYGDYLTIHRYQGCANYFTATSYAWDRAPVINNRGINARWVEFGRSGDAPCWQAHQ